MGTRLTGSAYADLIRGDLLWLLRQSPSPEREHIEAVLLAAPERLAERDAALARVETAEARVAEAERALRNCLLMASAAIAYKSRGGEEDWRGVVRFCAEGGVKPSVLRDDAPESEAP